jgi:hypothetical protein
MASNNKTRRQMPVVILDHAGVLVPERLLATTISGTPFITASQATPSARRSVKPVNAVRGSHYCDTVGAKGDFQIQLSCPLAEQALAAAVAAGHRVVALGRE